jgi:hypothetical protein
MSLWILIVVAAFIVGYFAWTSYQVRGLRPSDERLDL